MIMARLAPAAILAAPAIDRRDVPAVSAGLPSSNSHTGPPEKPKTNQACENCRGRKIRCSFDANVLSQKCRRCARSGQECIFKIHGRKRPRKRTDTRVGELERQVKLLSSLLGHTESPESANNEDDSLRDQADDPETRISFSNVSSFDQSTVPLPSLDNSDSYWPRPTTGLPCHIALSLSSNLDQPPTLSATELLAEITSEHRAEASSSTAVIENGLISLETATELFDMYNAELVQQYPQVIFSEYETAQVVRFAKPTLFLAVIAAAAGRCNPSLHDTLNAQLLRVFAERIFLNGDRSIELVQSLLITIVWLNSPEGYKRVRFYQYTHMAATMALDLGLEDDGGEVWSPQSTYNPACPFESEARSFAELERLRILIACYTNCSTVSRSLRRQNMMPSSDTVGRWADSLETAPYSTLLDKRLAAQMKLGRVMDDAGVLLSKAGAGGVSDLDDMRVQHTVRLLQTNLQDWKSRTDAEILCPFLEVLYWGNHLYVHEIALYRYYETEDFRPPFRLSTPRDRCVDTTRLTSPEIECFSSLISSAHSLLDVFLGLDDRSLRGFPDANIVRITYAILILLKIYLICRPPGSKLGLVLSPPILQIDRYLNSLYQHWARAGDGGRCRAGEKFFLNFVRLRNWYQSNSQCATNGGMVDELIEPFIKFGMQHGQPGPLIDGIPPPSSRRTPPNSARAHLPGSTSTYQSGASAPENDKNEPSGLRVDPRQTTYPANSVMSGDHSIPLGTAHAQNPEQSHTELMEMENLFDFDFSDVDFETLFLPSAP